MGEGLCVFGASSTWGAWDLEKSGWVSRLRLYLDSIDSGIFTYNLGISGNTTRDLLKRFDVEANSRDPGIFVFSIGDNDSVYLGSEREQLVPLGEFGENLDRLVKKAKSFTDKIILLGCKRVDESRTTPVPWATDHNYKNGNIEEYNRRIKEVANDNEVIFVELFDLLNKDDLEDGLHPNSKGHEKIFQVVKKALSKNDLL